MTMQQSPSRTSYTIHEIAMMRSMSEQAVLDDIYHGQLKAHVWLPIMPVEIFTKHQIGDKILYDHKTINRQGYFELFPCDVRHLFRKNTLVIKSFPGETPETKIQLQENAPIYSISKDDIVILQESLNHLRLKNAKVGLKVKSIIRFEDAIKAMYPNYSSFETSETLNDPTFQTLHFKGYDYVFGPVQANIIKQLFEAYHNGKRMIHFNTLLNNAGSNSMYMREVFRSQKRWRELIHHNGSGYYWLNPEYFDTPAQPHTSIHTSTDTSLDT